MNAFTTIFVSQHVFFFNLCFLRILFFLTRTLFWICFLSVKMVNSFLQVDSFCPQVLCSVSWVYFHWPQRTHSCQRLDHSAPERRWFFPCYGQDSKQGHSGKNHTGSTCSKDTFKIIITAQREAVWIWILLLKGWNARKRTRGISVQTGLSECGCGLSPENGKQGVNSYKILH